MSKVPIKHSLYILCKENLQMDQVVKNKIQKELETFNREQLISFAWLCAVRSLPFLGI